jgi:hypothetical protein
VPGKKELINLDTLSNDEKKLLTTTSSRNNLMRLFLVYININYDNNNQILDIYIQGHYKNIEAALFNIKSNCKQNKKTSPKAPLNNSKKDDEIIWINEETSSIKDVQEFNRKTRSITRKIDEIESSLKKLMKLENETKTTVDLINNEKIEKSFKELIASALSAGYESEEIKKAFIELKTCIVPEKQLLVYLKLNQNLDIIKQRKQTSSVKITSINSKLQLSPTTSNIHKSMEPAAKKLHVDVKSESDSDSDIIEIQTKDPQETSNDLEECVKKLQKNTFNFKIDEKLNKDEHTAMLVAATDTDTNTNTNTKITSRLHIYKSPLENDTKSNETIYIKNIDNNKTKSSPVKSQIELGIIDNTITNKKVTLNEPTTSRAINEQTTLKTNELRNIIIDGSNVAREHGAANGNRNTFSCKGLKIVVDYFLKRGHTEIKAFIPLFRRGTADKFCPTVDNNILEDLYQRGFITFTPSRFVENQLIVPYDDRFILKAATHLNAVIVSNDNYRDLMKENEEWKNIIINK